jgi:hypothetical protein
VAYWGYNSCPYYTIRLAGLVSPRDFVSPMEKSSKAESLRPS